MAIATGAGAVTDIVHFEAEDPTLSNLIQHYPHLQNPITEFLQTNPDDPEALNRFKRAVEGAGLGMFFPVIFKGVQKGFTYTRTAATEKIIKSNLKQTDSGWNRRRDNNGDVIKGSYHARVDEQDLFIDYNKATKRYDVTVNNMLGQTVYSASISTLLTTIDLSTFDKGIYTVELKDHNTTYTEKVIIE